MKCGKLHYNNETNKTKQKRSNSVVVISKGFSMLLKLFRIDEGKVFPLVYLQS